MFDGKMRRAWFESALAACTIDEVTNALIVIDMQPNAFPAARSTSTIDAVLHEIDAAIERGDLIVLLNSRGKGKVEESISRAACGGRLLVVEKAKNDGASDILLSLGRNKLRLGVARVCGVNALVCVQETVSTLAALCPDCRIDVVVSACNSGEPFEWTDFVLSENVRLQ